MPLIRFNTFRYFRLICLPLIMFSVLPLIPTKADEPDASSSNGSFAIDTTVREQIDRLVNDSINKGDIPGAVVAFGNKDGILYQKAFGDRQIFPTREKMTVDSIFDLASLTKVVCTTVCVHLLADRGLINLNQKAAFYLPEFGLNGKDQLTVRQCLTHTAGFVPDNPISEYQGSPDRIWNNICQMKLAYSPGQKFVYSDLGFIVLGKIVERISGMPLDRFAEKNIYSILNMNDTSFNPPQSKRVRIVPTEKRDGHYIRGQVHDPRSFALKGVAGHAGLFSTANDLSVLCSVLLNKGKISDHRAGQPDLQKRNVSSTIENTSKDRGSALVFSNDHHLFTEKTFEKMTEDQSVPGLAKLYPGNNIRSLGWDKKSVFSRNRSSLLSNSAFGHSGFTGTVLWIDPDNNFYLVFLSSRLHPDGKGSVADLARKIGDSVLSSRH